MNNPQEAIPREALQRAAELLGGRERLAQKLGVKTEDLEKWTEGQERAPSGIVLAALNLIESSAGQGN